MATDMHSSNKEDLVSTQPLAAAGREHDVVITVNERPVTVLGPKATGLEIKQSAIAQGVPIQLDFLLYEERENGHTDPVRDETEVTVNKNSRFVAIANDDNS
jgi:hypothetical protein